MMPKASLNTSSSVRQLSDETRSGATRSGRMAVMVSTLAVVVALSGCSTVSKVNPFKEKAPADKVSQGERISVVAFEQKLKASDTLTGVDFFVPEAQAVTDWPTPAGPGTGAPEHVTAAKDFKVDWSRSVGTGTGKGAVVIAQPVSDGTAIYTLDGGARVSALDVTTGRQLWSRDLNPKLKRDKQAFGGGLTVRDGKLYVTSGFRFVAALDASDGKVIWEKTVEAPVHTAPSVSDRYVIVTDVDNQITAMDLVTGEQGWTYQALVEPARIMRSTGGTLSENVYYAPFSSGELIALDANTGTPLWTEVLARSTRTNALSEIRDISGRPVIYKNEIYAASHSGMFAAIDPKNGDKRWTLAVDSVNTPWAAGDVIYLTSLQGELMAVNRDTGQIYWLVDLNEAAQKGKKKKKKAKNLPVWTGPVLASDRLIMLNSEGDAVAFNPKTGARETALKLGKGAFIQPVAVGERLYVLTDNAKLVAIR
jgi:outer membrane protein assembly factor BamB